jgi:hypothetical protein
MHHPAPFHESGNKRGRSDDEATNRYHGAHEPDRLGDLDPKRVCEFCFKVCRDIWQLNLHLPKCQAKYIKQKQEDMVLEAAAAAACEQSEGQDLDGYSASNSPDKALLEMCTRWREISHIPNNHIFDIKEDITHTILPLLTKGLSQNIDTIYGVNLTPEQLSTAMPAVFDSIHTTHAERAAATKHFQPCRWHKRILGYSTKKVPTSYGTKLVREDHIVVDVSIEDQLAKQAYSDYLFDEMFKDRRSTDDDVIADVHDGTLYREHPLFGSSNQCSSIPIGVYGDDFEQNCGIGPSAGVYKISVYYGINYALPQYLRWNNENMLLLCIALSSTVKQYGHKKVEAHCYLRF